MKKLQISLKPGERIYVNGAVLKVDRKVSIEFLNDVTFLLEHHVIQPEDTRTPLRQLYFMVQTVLIDPANGDEARRLFYEMFGSVSLSFENPAIRQNLIDVRDFFDRGRLFDALKLLRSLFPIEDAIIGQSARPETNGPDQHCEVR
ncbi:MAG: flagellar biosynthesis repressor FlbT [Hyphomicrobium sp.]